MKIGDKIILTEGIASVEFSYGMGDENNPATHIEVTKQNIGHLTELESIGIVKIVKAVVEEIVTSEELPPEPEASNEKEKQPRKKKSK